MHTITEVAVMHVLTAVVFAVAPISMEILATI